MSEAHQRSKQPEFVRARLIDVAIDLIVERGYESLTLDKVAKSAGVSKGGLQHHFSSKAVLLSAVCDFLCDQFEPLFEELLLDEPKGPKQFSRAYIKACFKATNPTHLKAMLVLTLALPDFAKRQGDWLRELMKQESELYPSIAKTMLLCRFASDGLIIAETSGVLSFNDHERTELMNSLLSMVDALD